MINLDWLPSNDFPGLTEQSLVEIGSIIRRARDAAADDHKPETGETTWTLGVSGYERTCFALTTESSRLAYLEIKMGAGGGPTHFVMTIGGHPIRFYRGNPEDAPIRYRQPSLPELLEQQRTLDPSFNDGRSLRLVIDNDSSGRPSGIYVIQLDSSGETTSVYQIPRAVGNIAPFVPPVPPVDLPPAVAEPVDDNQDQERRNISGE